jgi:hypothetical protein
MRKSLTSKEVSYMFGKSHDNANVWSSGEDFSGTVGPQKHRNSRSLVGRRSGLCRDDSVKQECKGKMPG